MFLHSTLLLSVGGTYDLILIEYEEVMGSYSCDFITLYVFQANLLCSFSFLTWWMKQLCWERSGNKESLVAIETESRKPAKSQGLHSCSQEEMNPATTWMSWKADAIPAEPDENDIQPTPRLQPWFIVSREPHPVPGLLTYRDSEVINYQEPLSWWWFVREKYKTNALDEMQDWQECFKKEKSNLYFNSLAFEPYLWAFSILKLPTLYSWSYLDDLDLEAWGANPKANSALSAILESGQKLCFFSSWSIFIPQVRIISWAIIIQHQVCNIWIEILLTHQEKK